MTYRVDIAGVVMEHAILNASGFVKTLEEVRLLARSLSAAVVLGSITLAQREGNIGTTLWISPNGLFSLNSLGLPNPGAEYYKLNLPEMVKVVHGAGKPLFVSVAGFNSREFSALTELSFEGGADAVILNFGCPNVWDTGEQKRIVSFYPDLVYDALTKVGLVVGSEVKVIVKVSPISDPYLLVQIAQVIGEFELVKAVVACNTFPNGFFLDGVNPVITFGKGFGGVAGVAMKPIVMGQVKQWREALPTRIQIVAAGGVNSAADVLDYLNPLVGAIAVKVGTGVHDQGIRIFDRLVTEYVGLVEL
ncbi:hypothetical protein A2801_01385 [Candidatus Woesebacteria bacterium RIFCSPHIGHO2_01_FULL_41_10]|uniref:Dihydroorotate dehydrogenase catalytic domain-containing protein n=1 Tax=Candidatus Woesebacteria bacterium RIFCSPHIGHO2_01_FULL_41_10 TaxID=1802500 RepID=A0A1F7YSS6_9BACT|nr:MAG: hypothetical protein A2801_01385 [Candidatus Woesebacteria bacterium RIFCSPHIGHO2_01_FULL_41_10]